MIKSKNPLRNAHGAGLVEIMVVVGIMAVMGLTLSTMMTNLYREQSFITDKVESLIAQSLLTQSFIPNIGNCNLTLQNKPFNKNSPPQRVDINEIVMGPATNISAIVRTKDSTYKDGFVVKDIYLENFVKLAPDTDFRSNLVIEFNDRIRALKKYSVPLLFRTNPAGNAIATCQIGTVPNLVVLNRNQSQVYPAGSCPGGFLLEPSLNMFRDDGHSDTLAVGAAMPIIDGFRRYDLSIEFGSKKGGGAGHSWDYMIKGLSRRYYLDPLTFNTNMDHTFQHKFFVGDRGVGNFGEDAGSLTGLQEGDTNKIRYIDTKLMIQCLK
jgi:hypothetical protein